MGNSVTGIWFTADKLFSDFNEIILLKGCNMAGKVAVGHVDECLKRIEVDPVVYHQYRHDTKPDPAVKDFI